MLAVMGSEQSSLSCNHLTKPVCTCFGHGVAESPPSERSRLQVSSYAESATSVEKVKNNSYKVSLAAPELIKNSTSCCTHQETDVDNFLYKLHGINEQEECRKIVPSPEINGYVPLKNGFVSQNNCSCSVPQPQTTVDTVLDLKNSSHVCFPKGYQPLSGDTQPIESDLQSNNNECHDVQSKHDRNQKENGHCPIENTLTDKELSKTSKIKHNVDTLVSQTTPKATLNETKDSKVDLQEELRDCHFFRNLVLTEEARLQVLAETWNKLLNEPNNCPPDVCDEVRSVVGQTKLVIAERFPQFSKLIDRADGQVHSELPPVLLSDLQGFWEMIYFQVLDVTRKFDRLATQKNNNWKSIEKNHTKSLEAGKKNLQKNRMNGAAAKKTQTKEDKRRREAARKRLAEARKALALKKEQNANQTVVGSTISASETTDPSLPLVQDDRLNIAPTDQTSSCVSDVILEIESPHVAQSPGLKT